MEHLENFEESLRKSINKSQVHKFQSGISSTLLMKDIKEIHSLSWLPVGNCICVRGGAEEKRLAIEYLEHRNCEYDLKKCVDFYKEYDPQKPVVTEVIVQVVFVFYVMAP